MKVKELQELLKQCNPEADVIMYECRWFDPNLYYKIRIESVTRNTEKPLLQKESTPEKADLIILR